MDTRPVHWRRGLLLAGLLFLEGPALARPQSSTLNRPSDPVVLTGADVPTLVGILPGEIVAFKYTGSWVQIPVQVDERANVDFVQVYNNLYALPPMVFPCYTDAGTFTGVDPNPALDADDEIVFMARDAGGRPAAFSEPANVAANSGVEITITDPLGSGTGTVYLFQRSGIALVPSAGQSYVTYAFSLLSGPYLSTYNIAGTPRGTPPTQNNPENTTLTTAFYRHHFSDRWIDDELNLYAGGATGVDILDRHKNLYAPGVCTRSEDTFSGWNTTSQSEGAFVTNKPGPVRAIRSYLGANSGPITQREHLFYERRHDIATFLRVHSGLPGIMDYFDYNAAASGMTYHNDLNTAGVAIDGAPDAVTAGPPQWEMVRGPQGGLVTAHRFTTDIPAFTATNYYLDTTTPPVTQCTGDAVTYGASGTYVTGPSPLPNMDPILGAANTLTHRRILYYEPPAVTVADAQNRNIQASAPLSKSAAVWQGLPAIGLSVTALGFAAPVGGPNPAGQTVRITNTGGGTLNWSAASGAAWLAIGPVPAGLAPNAWQDLTVSVDVVGTALAAGPYAGTITVSAPGASNAPRTIDVTLDVNNTPAIGLSPASLAFSAPVGGPNPVSQTLRLTNTGTGTLNWSASDNAAWLAVTAGPGSLAAGTFVDLTVSVDVITTALAAGPFGGTITLTAPGASNTPQTIPVSLAVNGMPTLGLSPSSLSFAATEGGGNPPAQTLTVTNTGAGTLTWTVAPNAGWLTLAPSPVALAAGASQALTVSIDITSLAAGSRPATITVTAAGASNSPQAVPVTLTVSPAPVILGGGGGGGGGGCGLSGLETLVPLLLLALLRRLAS